MQKILWVMALVLAICVATAYAGEMALEAYLSGFDYQAHKDMKIDSETLVKSLMEGNIQLIDIRFKGSTRHGAWDLPSIFLSTICRIGWTNWTRPRLS